MFEKRLTCKTFRIDICIIEPYVYDNFVKMYFAPLSEPKK